MTFSTWKADAGIGLGVYVKLLGLKRLGIIVVLVVQFPVIKIRRIILLIPVQFKK
jgi:hypothetical protein